jgi:hypothetical protein
MARGTSTRDTLNAVKRWLVVSALVATIAIPVTASAVVTHGTITPNRGARGIKLGMTRAQVIAKLGQPVFKNANGYMQYGPNNPPGIVFDVYLDISKHPNRVRLLGIYGSGFCLVNGGPCLTAKGGVGKLRDRYGSALTTVTLEDGEQVVWLKGHYRGCDVFTEFGEPGRPRSARIGMIFIGFQSGSAC